MIDLREHKDAIKRAVSIERLSDECYSWSIKSVRKGKVLIRWSYLSDSECFDIVLEPCGPDCYCLFFHDPHENFHGGYSIGNSKFDDFSIKDVSAVDKALAACVKSIARNAHHLY